MTNASLPHFDADQYGAVDFEGEFVPCAFGGQPGHMTAYILLGGVCRVIGLPLEGEIQRILEHHLLVDGLGLVSFPMLAQDGKPMRVDQPAISLVYLHTWLAMIPPDIVENEELRQKLERTQRHFTEVVYAYFGRRILPQEIRSEDDPYLEPDRRKLYDYLERAGEFDTRLSSMEETVRGLVVQISAGESGENISADQQEQLKAMIDLLSSRYEAKYGKGTRGRMIADIKTQHNFHFFNTVAKSTWPALVRDLVYRFRQLTPKGTPLPPVFKIAQDSVEQSGLF